MSDNVTSTPLFDEYISFANSEALALGMERALVERFKPTRNESIGFGREVLYDYDTEQQDYAHLTHCFFQYHIKINLRTTPDLDRRYREKGGEFRFETTRLPTRYSPGTVSLSLSLHTKLEVEWATDELIKLVGLM